METVFMGMAVDPLFYTALIKNMTDDPDGAAEDKERG